MSGGIVANLVLLFLLIICPIALLSQNRNSNWCFGDSAGIDFSISSSPDPIITGMDSRGSCVSISDTGGFLLFYAYNRASVPGDNTTLVNNNNHQIMLNGDSIVGTGWYNELVIVPYPNTDTLFYLFSIGGISNNNNLGLYYSIVNINGNGGLGEIMAKNVNLLSFRTVDCLTSVKHGNGRDWWLVVRHYSTLSGGNNEWYTLLVSPAGFSNYNLKTIGQNNSTNLASICTSKLGAKLCFVNFKGNIEVYDFDRCTGMLSNSVLIEQESMPYPHYVSCSFSNDDSRLYVTSTSLSQIDSSYLFQYNLDAANISSSKDTIWEVSFPASIGFLKLAPDGKIYLSSAYDNLLSFYYPYPDSIRNYINENLSVINAPDSLGAACDFQPFSFYLGGKRTYHGLPNNSDYDLGPVAGSPCDSLTGIQDNLPTATEGKLHLTYISAWEKLFVNAEGIRGKNAVLELYDLNGRRIYWYQKPTTPPYFTQDVNVAELRAGVYLVRLTTEKESLNGRFVKQ